MPTGVVLGVKGKAIMSDYKNYIDRLKREIDTADLADRLGLNFDRSKKSAHCFNVGGHPNNDRHPSLGFYEKDGVYRFKCFACGVSGTAIDLYAQVKGIVPCGESPTKKQLVEVCNELGEMYGIQPPNNERRGAYKRKNEPKVAVFDYKPITYQEPRINKSGEYEPPKYQAIYQEFYDACDPPNAELRKWWQDRGLTPDLLMTAGWRIQTPKTWAYIEKRYSDSDLVESGLKTPKNGQLRRVFGEHNNVIVPLFNGTLESLVAKKQPPIITLRARDLHDKERKDRGEWSAKYLQPIATELCLYNYNRLYEWLTLYNSLPPIYITESETDALAFYDYMRLYEGQDVYVVALEGASKDENSLVIRELLKTIEIKGKRPPIGVIKDADEAGDHFLTTLQRAFIKAGWHESKIKTICPWAKLGLKDMGDYLKYMREHKPKDEPPSKT